MVAVEYFHRGRGRRLLHHNIPLLPPQHNMIPHLFSASQALIQFLETYQLTRPSMPHAWNFLQEDFSVSITFEQVF